MDGSAGLAASRACNVPLFITEHTGPFTILMANSIVKRWTLRSLHSAEKVIVVSEAQRRAVAEYLLPTRRDHLVVLPNVVDTDMFTPPAEWRPEPAAPRIVFVGYFVPIKQLPMLLEAFRQVRRSVPGARLSLVGGGEIEQQEKDLLVEIRGMGLDGSVEVIGHRSREEIARIMREECDLLVLCSRSETFGCVVIEALASGKPVVATRCGGPEDIITHEDLGLICENNNPQALANAILRVIERLPQFDSSRIRRHAEEQFSFAAVARRIAALYESARSAKVSPMMAPSPVAG
jgi:glycosyltransferase involved in cell wall biosynthesis